MITNETLNLKLETFYVRMRQSKHLVTLAERLFMKIVWFGHGDLKSDLTIVRPKTPDEYALVAISHILTGNLIFANELEKKLERQKNKQQCSLVRLLRLAAENNYQKFNNELARLIKSDVNLASLAIAYVSIFLGSNIIADTNWHLTRNEDNPLIRIIKCFYQNTHTVPYEELLLDEEILEHGYKFLVSFFLMNKNIPFQEKMLQGKYLLDLELLEMSCASPFLSSMLISEPKRIYEATNIMFGYLPSSKHVRSNLSAYLLICAWSQLDIKKCHDLFKDYKDDVSKDVTFKNNGIFFYYVLNLCIYWQRNTELYNHNGPLIEGAYVVGDSHSLSANGMIISENNFYYRLSSHLIMGIKMHHIAEKYSYYLSALRELISNAPEEKPLLLTIGEIDCRQNEGILPYAKANGLNVVDVIDRTVADYIKNVSEILSEIGFKGKIIQQGIPAPNTEDVSGELTELVKLVNIKLKDVCDTYNWIFFDVYSLTHSSDDAYKGTMHIDAYHLVPAIYGHLNI